MLTDLEKINVLKASLLNIGRLLPEGMSVTFTRDPGTFTTIEQVFPDGRMETGVFTSASPIYMVPETEAKISIKEWF